MKNSIKTAVLGLAALVSGFSACNDADYDTLGVHAFVSESASNKSTKVTITELGADAEITACLSEAATKDVKLKFVVDSEVLDRYNQKQASSFLVLPEEVYEMDSEVTIKAGEFSAPATKIHIKPLPKEYVGESYALPLRLVSADGSVPVTSLTSTCRRRFPLDASAVYGRGAFPSEQYGRPQPCRIYQRRFGAAALRGPAERHFGP